MTADPPIPDAKRTATPPDAAALTRVVLLGLNAWLVVLLIPSLHVGLFGLVDLALIAAPLGVLGPGLAVLRSGKLVIARWVLCAAVPAAMGGAIALRPALVELEAYGTIGLALGAASLLAYLAAAAHAVSADRELKEAIAQPLVGKEPVVEPLARRWLRRLMLGSAAVGAFALTVIAPSLPSQREREAAWGDAADDAAVLTAVVASLVTAIALAALIGPGLRAVRPTRDEPARRRRRLAAAMLIGTAAAVGWMVLRQLERSS
jgi:hypothetical protein